MNDEPCSHAPQAKRPRRACDGAQAAQTAASAARRIRHRRAECKSARRSAKDNPPSAGSGRDLAARLNHGRFTSTTRGPIYVAIPAIIMPSSTPDIPMGLFTVRHIQCGIIIAQVLVYCTRKMGAALPTSVRCVYQTGRLVHPQEQTFVLIYLARSRVCEHNLVLSRSMSGPWRKSRLVSNTEKSLPACSCPWTLGEPGFPSMEFPFPS